MTINIDELRRLAQAAMTGPDGVSLNWVKLLQDFQKEANPATVSELLDRLEEAERASAHIKEVEFPRKMRAVAVGLETKCARLEQERDALRAKIAETENQQPVAWCATDETGTVIEALGMNQSRRFDTPLYLAPGAQPAPSFADAYQGAMEEVAIWKSRALEAETLNRKFIAGINGPMHMGEPAQPAPSVPGLLESLRCACNYIDKLGGVSQQYRAMLAAAPEAKP